MPQPAHAPGKPVSVLLIEDHLVLAESLASLLRGSPGIEVAGIATTLAEAVEAGRRLQPDVLLVALILPDGSGTEAATLIRAGGGHSAIVFLTGDERLDAIAEAIEAGGSAFISKAAPPDVVVDSILRAARGEMLIQPNQVQQALQERRASRRREREREAMLASLTPREVDVLRLLAQGRDVAAIARDLKLSVLTVRTHVRSLLAKLEAHSQLEAVARAQALDLLVDGSVKQPSRSAP